MGNVEGAFTATLKAVRRQVNPGYLKFNNPDTFSLPCTWMRS
jgi:hypothetical protein